MMIDRGERFTTFPVEGWYDCGKPETMLETNRYLLSLVTEVPAIDGVLIRPPVQIAPTARVDNCVIGPNAAIGDGAVLNNAIVSDSIIGDGAVIERSVLVGSIVGERARVEGAPNSLNLGADSEIKVS
jgi:glucose-1-phosphate thymidylyltransferase